MRLYPYLLLYRCLVWYLLILISVLILFGCDDSCEDRVDEVLTLSGDNRSELETVLSYYSDIHPDQEKLKAVQFLIANMRFHNSDFPIYRQDSGRLKDLVQMADSLLYSFVTQVQGDSLYTKATKKAILPIQTLFKDRYGKALLCDSTEIEWKKSFDYKQFTSKQLIAQIEQAFRQRRLNSHMKNISFDDFCEYVLPYRVIPYYPFENFSDISRIFMDKYLAEIPKDSVVQVVQRYNYIMNTVRDFFPFYPYKHDIGNRGMFLHNYRDCIPIAHFGVSALRACGIPSAIEYNIAYKEWHGRHYFSVIQNAKKEWLVYNSESSLPTVRDDSYFKEAGSMNIYRLMFSEQHEAPFFLRGGKEYVPRLLASPFIKDVTSHLMPTFSLTLPYNGSSGNKLAYLATFSSDNRDGLVPVTWGKVNRWINRVTFNTVVPERLYYPVYYDSSGKAILFGEPFYLDRECRLTQLSTLLSNNCTAKETVITRKFPIKLDLQERARKLIGTVVLASNNSSFSKADTIGFVHQLLSPAYQDIVLDMSKGPYRYYRVRPAKGSSNGGIAEVQFITNAAYHYTNVIEPSSLPVFYPTDVIRSSDVRLMDQPLDQIKKRAEYDGNSQTGIRADSVIQFYLAKPHYVTKLRIMPQHANNGVVLGDQYQLLYWAGDAWREVDTRIAKYNYLSFSVSRGKLYWLRNLTEGEEEIPFIIDDSGNQKFLYHDFLVHAY